MRTPAAATALGAALVVALTALDAYWGDSRVIAATVVIGPFLTALAGNPRQTAAVAALAVVSAVLSGIWNENFLTDAYFVRLAVVVAGSGFAVLGARNREHLAADRERFRLLRGAAELADAEVTVPEVVERVQKLLVPAFVESAAIEIGGAQPTGVRLRSRGRDIGSLVLSGELSPQDEDFAHLLAGRIALALDNAGLYAALEQLRTRLTTALDSLAEAVTIQDSNGRLVYANEAAARALDFDSAEALLATDPRDIIDAYETFLENGRSLTLEDLPGRHVLAGETPPPLLVRAVHKVTGEERWRIVKATPVEGGLAVNVIEDVTDVKRAELAQRFLAEASAVLASSLDYEQTLARIADLAVPRLGDWCGVSLPSGDWLRSVAVAHADPVKVDFARIYEQRYPTPLDAPTGAPQVLRDAEPQLVNDITDELLDAAIRDPVQREAIGSLGMRAVIIVPMLTGGRAIGVITLVRAESNRTFTEADLELAKELGRRAGTAVEHARLYRERSHIAATLQRGLLPDALPRIPGLRLASLYRPAGAENLVGGDFYDAFPTDDGWMLLVGDVTGRGAEAAAQTGQARHTLRTAGTLLSDPERALAQLNRALTERRELAPCTVAIVHVRARTASVLCAGHPQPLLIREGAVSALGHFGPMVGAWADSGWSAETYELLPGDVVVLYTDGVTDARGQAERFGDTRLLATLTGSTDAPGAVAAIDRALNAFQRGSQADDTAVLAFDLSA